MDRINNTTYRKVLELVVAALSIHVGEAFHVLELPFPFPVTQRLVHIVLLDQYHIGNLNNTYLRFKGLKKQFWYFPDPT